jgi:hypothetical protein
MNRARNGKNHPAPPTHTPDEGDVVPLGPRSRLAAGLAAVLLAATGCGSEEAPEGPLAKKPESPSASPSASSAPTPPPVPEPTDDEAGRRAFAQWFVQAFAYAFATNDPTPITDVGATEKRVECSTCTAFAEFLEEREAKGLTLQPSEYDVKKVFPTGRVRDVHIYTLITRRPAYSDVSEDGATSKPYPTDKAYPIEVGLRYHDGAYEITGWTAGKGNQS